MKQRIFRIALALLSVGFVCQSAVAGTSPIACKLVDNIDPGSGRFQFLVTNTCVSPACMTGHVNTVTIPAGGKIVVKAFVPAKNKVVGMYTFTLDKPLAPKESIRFDRKPQGTSCKATATW